MYNKSNFLLNSWNYRTYLVKCRDLFLVSLKKPLESYYH